MRAAVLTAVLAGGVAAAPVPKEPPVPAVTKEHITASQNNLKQIGIAFHNYASANNDAWAGDVMDKDGRPALSWRVVLLPYLEQDALFKQFKLDEPWDSENNKKLVEKMPKVYAPVRVKAKPGETFYQTFVGKDALFEPLVKYKIGNVPDGTSNTALVAEAAEPVVWTKPSGIPFNAKLPVPKLGGLFDGEASVLRCDGSVFLMRKDPDETQLKYLIMPADGMVLDDRKLEK